MLTLIVSRQSSFSLFNLFPQPESDTPESSLHSPSFVEKRTMDGARLLVKSSPRSSTMNFALRGKGTYLTLFTRKLVDSQPSNLPLLLSFFSLFSSKTAPSFVFWFLLETATQVKSILPSLFFIPFFSFGEQWSLGRFDLFHVDYYHSSCHRRRYALLHQVSILFNFEE